MNETNKTLGQFINQGSQQRSSQEMDIDSFNTYLTLFAVNLVHRFPDVSDIESIDYNTVTNIAKLSYICSKVAVSTWNELVPQQNQLRPRLQRSA